MNIKNTYILNHGYGPGTLPRDVKVWEHHVVGYKDCVELDRRLTRQEINMYDITPMEMMTNARLVSEFCREVLLDNQHFVKTADMLLADKWFCLSERSVTELRNLRDTVVLMWGAQNINTIEMSSLTAVIDHALVEHGEEV